MSKNHERFFGVIFILFISLLLVSGCGKKEESGEVQKPDTSKSTAIDTNKKMSETPKDTLPDVTGNWKGTFDQRSATMNVIKQTGENFSAIMTINYRQPLTKTVNGTIDPENKTVKMEDINSSRFSGQYSAQLSAQGKEISGTFIMRSDNKSYTFSFKMK